jgi:hypothetical protein
MNPIGNLAHEAAEAYRALIKVITSRHTPAEYEAARTRYAGAIRAHREAIVCGIA